MKKTVSVNIKGLNFLVEEDAYELLQDYLERLKRVLSTAKDSNEILEDIELRIAELCSQRLNDSKSVIEMNDIQEIIAMLGEPEEYVEQDEEDQGSSTYQQYGHHSERRLFRDTENATFAGVCAGIANYLHWDVVIVRAIFVLIFLFGGFGLPLYIILWIIIPKAKSTIDKLRMKGRPITVETVREEVENAAENITKKGRKFSRAVRNDDQYSKRVSRVGRVIASIIGIGLIGFGLMLLIPFLIFMIGGFDFIPVQSEQGLISFPELGDLVLANSGDFTILKIGMLMAGFSIILFLFSLGSMLIMRINNTWSKLSLLVLFITGIIGFFICMNIAMRTGTDFVAGGEVEKEIGSIQTTELFVRAKTNEPISKTGMKIKSQDDFGLIEMDDKDITQYGVRFKYIQSADSLFHIHELFEARGGSHKSSVNRAENIQHNINLDSNLLILDTYYRYPVKDKLRAQQVTVVIEIPNGGSVHVDDRIIKLGGDDDNHDDYNERYPIEDGYLKRSGKYRHWD